MSAENIHDVGPPEHLTQRTTKEGHLDNNTPRDLTLTKRFPERSPEEKLALLQEALAKVFSCWVWMVNKLAAQARL